MKRAALALSLGLLVLAGCRDEPADPAPTPTPTVAVPRTLVAANLDFAMLGPKIVGPQGPEVETVLSAGKRQIGTMVSYVACPKVEADASAHLDGTASPAPCNPETQPKGAVYTYVHRVSLAEAEAADETPAPQPGDGPEVLESNITLFRTAMPVEGFTAGVGYDSAEAEAALGKANAITITLDSGHLIWRVTGGPGWTPGTTITFWWQSTEPPKGPQKAYLLEVDGNQALASGPFPDAGGDKASVGRTPR